MLRIILIYLLIGKALASIELTVGPEGQFKTIREAVEAAPHHSIINVESGIYRESVTISRNDITIRGINSPVISGAQTIQNWEIYSSQIYRSKINGQVGQVFVDNKLIDLARYPAQGYQQVSQESEIAEGLLQTDIKTDQEITGATLQIRTANWLLEERKIQSLGNNRLILNRTTKNPIKKGFGFYLENKIWMMTPGSWVYDSNDQYLYLMLPKDKEISTSQIEVSIRPGININADGIKIEGLKIEKTTDYAINIAWSKKNIVISKNRFSDLGGNGIIATGSSKVEISYNKLNNIEHDAINIKSSQHSLVHQNEILNNGLSTSPRFSEAAIIAANSTNAQITNNKIIRSAYNGIYFATGSFVHQNIIQDSCINFVDGAGIYTSHNDSRNGENTIISENIISGSLGTYDGSPYQADYPVAGIYLDEQTYGVTVEKNIISRNERGLYLNNSAYNTIKENIFFGNIFSQLHLDEFKQNLKVHSNEVLQNEFYPLDEKPSILLTSTTNNQDFARFDENTYSELFGQKIVKTQFKKKAFLNLEAWRIQGQDLNGKTVYNQMISETKNLVQRMNSIWSEDSSASFNNGDIITKKSFAIVSSNDFPIRKQVSYLVQIEAYSAEETSINLAIRRSGSPYDSILYIDHLSLKNNWNNFQFIVTAEKEIPNSRFDLEIPPSSRIKIRNMKVTEQDKLTNSLSLIIDYQKYSSEVSLTPIERK